jgi:hypothetical protein
MPKPKNNNKRKGMKFESLVQKTINSGALSFDKGDLKNDEYVIECKFTEKKGYRITTKLLDKLWDEALDSNKLPKLIVGIEDGKHRWMLNVSIEREVI